jgi:hypothetical protein
MMLVDSAFAEAIDGDEDIIGEHCPAERLWFRIGGIDIGFDGGFEFLGRPMHAAPDLFFGQQSEEALDLNDP